MNVHFQIPILCFSLERRKCYSAGLKPDLALTDLLCEWHIPHKLYTKSQTRTEHVCYGLKKIIICCICVAVLITCTHMFANVFLLMLHNKKLEQNYLGNPSGLSVLNGLVPVHLLLKYYY